MELRETFCESCGAVIGPSMMRCPHCHAVVRAGGIDWASAPLRSMGPWDEDVPEFEPIPDGGERRRLSAARLWASSALVLLAVLLLLVAFLSKGWYIIHMEGDTDDEPMTLDLRMGLSESHVRIKHIPWYWGVDVDGSYEHSFMHSDASYVTTAGIVAVLLLIGIFLAATVAGLVLHLRRKLIEGSPSLSRHLPLGVGVIAFSFILAALVLFMTDFPDQALEAYEDDPYFQYVYLGEEGLGWSFYVAVVAMVLLMVGSLSTYAGRPRVRSGPASLGRAPSNPVPPHRPSRRANPVLIFSVTLFSIGVILILVASVSGHWASAMVYTKEEGLMSAHTEEVDYGLYWMHVGREVDGPYPPESGTWDVEYDESTDVNPYEGVARTTLYLLVAGAAMAALGAILTGHAAAGVLEGRRVLERIATIALPVLAVLLVMMGVIYFVLAFPSAVRDELASSDLTKVGWQGTGSGLSWALGGVTFISIGFCLDVFLAPRF